MRVKPLLLGCLYLGLLLPAQASDEAPPSLELLEYLADYAEEDDGSLIDPLQQAADADPKDPYNDYLRKRAYAQ